MISMEPAKQNASFGDRGRAALLNGYPSHSERQALKTFRSNDPSFWRPTTIHVDLLRNPT